MEAKDTVMRYEQEKSIKDKVERTYKKKKGYDKMGLNWAYTDEDRRMIRIEMEEAVQEAQAEISFKAGYNEASKDLKEYNQIAIETIRKAGIREVVEWIESQRVAGKTLIEGIGYGIPVSDEKWHDQLEVWGVDKPKK